MSYLFQSFNLPVVLLVLVALAFLRWRKVGMLVWALFWWAAIYVVLSHAFKTPLPASVIKLYMGILSLVLFAYISSDRDRSASFIAPIRRLLLEPSMRPPLVLVILLFPALAAFNVYSSMNVPLEAPSFGRTVHPAPPDTITVHENELDLKAGENPYRRLEHDDEEAFGIHLENGRRVYFQNCFFCHGDAMAGDGMFIYGLNPIPTNFTDQGVLPMFQENFLMWRVAKGGPGMPEEGGPWDSAMPVWESFLTEDEMWDVILYLYEYTGFRPRERVVH